MVSSSAMGQGSKGWCPTVFDPMAAADGLLASVKPRVRGWTAVELRAIAAAAGRHGSGRLLLTHRGNLQVRGLSRSSADAFAAAISAAGLASADRHAERRRNILMLPAQTGESEAFAARLEAWLEAEESLAALPPKFCFAVTCDASHADCTAADVCIHVLGGRTWVTVCAGDMGDARGMADAGNTGNAAERGVLTDEPLTAVASITHAFVRLAAARSGKPRRMKDLIAAVGIDTVLAAGGLQATAFPAHASNEIPARVPTEFAPGPGKTVARVGPMVGRRFSLGVPFGRADSRMLYAVAALAERFGDGRLMLTAQRAFVLSGTTHNEQLELSAQARQAGFIIDPRDPRLRVAVCVGGSGCDRATLDVYAVAQSLAPSWGPEGLLHVSGCAKGCAHPHAAAVTLLPGAADGRLFVMRNSRADAVPSLSMTLVQVRELLTALAGRSSS